MLPVLAKIPSKLTQIGPNSDPNLTQSGPNSNRAQAAAPTVGDLLPLCVYGTPRGTHLGTPMGSLECPWAHGNAWGPMALQIMSHDRAVISAKEKHDDIVDAASLG